MEYDSNKRLPLFIYEFIQLFYYRDLIILMTGNILKNRYKRSILGVLWMLLNPLLQTIVLAIAFGTLFKSSVPGYHIYLLSGLIAWNFITQTTQYSMKHDDTKQWTAKKNLYTEGNLYCCIYWKWIS